MRCSFVGAVVAGVGIAGLVVTRRLILGCWISPTDKVGCCSDPSVLCCVALCRELHQEASQTHMIGSVLGAKP